MEKVIQPFSKVKSQQENSFNIFLILKTNARIHKKKSIY